MMKKDIKEEAVILILGGLAVVGIFAISYLLANFILK